MRRKHSKYKIDSLKLDQSNYSVQSFEKNIDKFDPKMTSNEGTVNKPDQNPMLFNARKQDDNEFFN